MRIFPCAFVKIIPLGFRFHNPHIYSMCHHKIYFIGILEWEFELTSSSLYCKVATEKLVTVYQTTWRTIPENRNPNL